MPLNLLAFVLVLISAIFFVIMINVRINAEASGSEVGTGTGTAVGKVIGSLEGMTVGQKEGAEKGKEEGQSAKDTEAKIKGKIQEVQKLEVLIASGTFSDILKVGDDTDPGYAALISTKYNAVFTVDLADADISLEEDELHIVLDQPTVELKSDGDIDLKNEYQKQGFIFKTGSAQDGYTLAVNSMNEIQEKATERLAEDESLMSSARTAAKNQLKDLVNAVSISKPETFVEFRDTKEGE